MSLDKKKELRKEIRSLRDALSQEERREKSDQISRKVIKMQEFQEADVVLLYSAIKSEVETNLIYEEAKLLGKNIYYPRVIGNVMEFYLVDESTEFEISRFGVREPKADAFRRYLPKEHEKIFVLVPGIAFDEVGNRIGYGGGYYDKYLHWLANEVAIDNICKVSVAYECQLVEQGRIESEVYDVKMDYVVIENQLIN